MTRPDLGGVFAPITTPFDVASGDIAPQHLKDNVARHFADGLDGVVVAGSTGEAPLLDPDEHRRAVAWTREATPQGKWLIAGTGAESTRQAIALTKGAAEAGADAVLVRPPSYFPAVAARALANYYRAIADASPIPVLLYNIPKYTHVQLPPELLEELSTHARVVGVKDSSGDLKNLAAYREAAPQWAVFVGSGSLLLPALELECDGGVVAVACYAARLCAELLTAFHAGDRDTASALQHRIGPLDKEIVSKLGPAGVKAAMDAVGLYGGPPRPPLAPLSEAERERVALLVRGD
ncbi:MAG TPA: dihydrodipicolinate synthase family protein [Gemmatimonadales bacterium]|nr:dihydrodipicolinate synthase family protein [Gemmatimonadales bacterium]